MNAQLIPIVLLLLGLGACGDDAGHGTDHPHPHPKPGGAAPPSDHGAATDLGSVTVAGVQFDVAVLGDVMPGAEGAFEVQPRSIPAAEIASLNAYLWIESQDGTQLSAPAKGIREGKGDALHFHLTPRKGEKAPFRVVLRLRTDSADERAGLPLDGHGHEHHAGPHDGVPATFRGGDVSGHLELKLHADKGDLELWLGEDAALGRPFDLPLDASVEIEFVDVNGRVVTLRPRNQTANEDEGGNANVRAGATNYFIFPSVDGEDASWLQGAEFQSIVIVRFARDAVEFASEEFVLKPHSH